MSGLRSQTFRIKRGADGFKRSGDKWGVGLPPSEGAVSGGTAALAFSAPALEHGQELTITTDGTFDFGARGQAAPVLWDDQHLVYENGVPNTFYQDRVSGEVLYKDLVELNINNITTPECPYTKILTPHPTNAFATYVSQQNLRHPRLHNNLRIKDAGHLGWPRSFGGQSPDPKHTKLFASWWFYTDLPLSLELYAFRDDTGTFNAVGLDQYPQPGELVRIEVDGDPTKFTTGQIYQIDYAQKTVYFTNDGNLPWKTGGATLNHMKLVGLETGATLILDKDCVQGSTCFITSTENRRSTGSCKFIRCWDNSDGKQLRTSWTQHQLGVGDGTEVAPNATNGYFNSPSNLWTPSPQQVVGRWAHLEFFQDVSDPTSVKTRVYIDGKLFHEAETVDVTFARDLTKGMNLALYGWDSNVYTTRNCFVGEMYADSDPKHVLITDAPSWTAYRTGNYRGEVQYPTAWAPNQIKVRQNQGAHDSLAGKRLFILNEHLDNISGESGLLLSGD